MNPKLKVILESKRAYRERLAALPIAEKLGMLDLLRERCQELATVRRASGHGRERTPQDRPDGG